jgi:hypothetical protein
VILPISTIKCKQWFYQYQQLNVNSDLQISTIKCKQWFYQYQQLNVNSDLQISTIKCRQWFYQHQQLKINSNFINKGNNKISEHRVIFQREMQNS